MWFKCFIGVFVVMVFNLLFSSIVVVDGFKSGNRNGILFFYFDGIYIMCVLFDVCSL